MKKNIAIFASGSGSNAEYIFKFFENHEHICVKAIFTNNPQAGVISRAHRLGVACIVFRRHKEIFELLDSLELDLIILAGYLKLIPASLLHKYPSKIINIHPALLPKYGGKGMYGMKVHEAVFENRDMETGITIHYVNDRYDEGEHILQAAVNIDASDNPDSIAQKVHQLEYQHYATTIENLLLS